jgi:hypothetical protein
MIFKVMRRRADGLVTCTALILPVDWQRGGIRIIYYAKTHEGIIWMLTIYAKNQEQSIPAHVLRKIKEEIDG